MVTLIQLPRYEAPDSKLVQLGFNSLNEALSRYQQGIEAAQGQQQRIDIGRAAAQGGALWGQRRAQQLGEPELESMYTKRMNEERDAALRERQIKANVAQSATDAELAKERLNLARIETEQKKKEMELGKVISVGNSVYRIKPDGTYELVNIPLPAEEVARREAEVQRLRAQSELEKQRAATEAQKVRLMTPGGRAEILKEQGIDPNSPEGQNFIKYGAGATAGQKPKYMSDSAIKNAQEEYANFREVSDLYDSFSPEKNTHVILPETRMAVGRYVNIPTVTPSQDAVEWWQRYYRYQQIIRHKYYGAVLTPQEQRMFERADIQPGMSNDVIRKNLQMQKNLLGNALSRSIEARTANGVPFYSALSGYGMTPEEYSQYARENPQSGSGAGATAPQNANPQAEAPAQQPQQPRKRLKYNPLTGELE